MSIQQLEPATKQEQQTLAQWEKQSVALIAEWDQKKSTAEKIARTQGFQASLLDITKTIQEIQKEVDAAVANVQKQEAAAFAKINTPEIHRILDKEVTFLLSDLNAVKGLPQKIAKDKKHITLDDVKHMLLDHAMSEAKLDTNHDGLIARDEILRYAHKEVDSCKLEHVKLTDSKEILSRWSSECYSIENSYIQPFSEINSLRHQPIDNVEAVRPENIAAIKLKFQNCEIDAKTETAKIQAENKKDDAIVAASNAKEKLLFNKLNAEQTAEWDKAPYAAEAKAIIRKELIALLPQLEKAHLGQYMGNGDKHITVAELDSTLAALSKNKSPIYEFIGNDGAVSVENAKDLIETYLPVVPHKPKTSKGVGQN